MPMVWTKNGRLPAGDGASGAPGIDRVLAACLIEIVGAQRLICAPAFSPIFAFEIGLPNAGFHVVGNGPGAGLRAESGYRQSG